MTQLGNGARIVWHGISNGMRKLLRPSEWKLRKRIREIPLIPVIIYHGIRNGVGKLPSPPPAGEFSKAATFRDGPDGLLKSWAMIAAAVIGLAAVGLVGALVLLPLVFTMLAIGVVWLLYRRFGP